MRILFFAPDLGVGGAEKHLAQIVRGLSALGYEITILGTNIHNWGDTYLRLANVQLVESQFDPQYNGFFNTVAKIFRFVQIIRDLHPDIIVGDRESGAFWAGLAGWIAGVPRLLSRRGDIPFGKRKRYPRLLEKLSFYVPAECIVNSEIVATGLSKPAEGIDRNKIRVIYQGVEIPHEIIGDVICFREQFMIPPDAIVIGMLATFWSVKNHILLLRAAARIIDSYPDVVFVLAGGAVDSYASQKKYYANVLTTIETLNLSRYVRLTGHLLDPSPFLATMDIGVLCSVAEGLSNTVLEYMAHGKPVIATRVGGNAEAVVHGETGLLIDSKDEDGLVDALLTLLKNPSTRAYMGQQGRKRVMECFTVERAIQQWDHLLKGIEPI